MASLESIGNSLTPPNGKISGYEWRGRRRFEPVLKQTASNIVHVDDAGERFDRGTDARVDAEATGERDLDLA
jgi:hypothetical protein